MKIKLGRYYLVDARYVNATGFLAPYHDVRYHLSEHRGGTLRTTKELFNKQHFQACNVIERTFGVLKTRFRMLNTALQYSMHVQVDIVLACCVLHNFIRLRRGRHVHDEELNVSSTQVHDDVKVTNSDDDGEHSMSVLAHVAGSSHAICSYSQRKRDAWNMI